MIPLGTVLLLAIQGVAPGGQPPAAAQATAEKGTTEGDGGWRLLDAAAVQAGDQIVTVSELDRFLERRSQQFGIPIPEEERPELLLQAIRPQVIEHLEAQAGEDLGLDPASIERVVRLTLQGRRRELGPNEYRSYLEQEGIDARNVGQSRSESIYGSAWRSRQVGYQNAGAERPMEDRFLRPGELRAIYRVNKASLGKPDKVRLQDLVVPVEALGGDVERTRALVENLRERAVGGADFDQLVEEFGVFQRETLGVTEVLEAARLVDEGIRAFATQAEVGDYTEVLPFVRQGETVAFHVVKLYEREEGEAPPAFDDPRLQRFLRREYQNKRDNDLLERARERLRERAYVWHAPGWELDESSGGQSEAFEPPAAAPQVPDLGPAPRSEAARRGAQPVEEEVLDPPGGS